MKNKDIHKKTRDSMDSTLENKFMTNLQWSMLFFCFDNMANIMNEENELKENNLSEFQAWNQTSQELITVARVNYFNINSILAANFN